MNQPKKPTVILIADDDPDDRLMAKEAFDENHLADDIRFVVDGEDLMDYLYNRNKYVLPDSAPRPGLVLLDLNMPKKDGREALREIKNDCRLRQIPIVVMTTSRTPEEVARVYDLGANSFITKPVSLTSFAETINVLAKYWFEIVELPFGG